MEHKRRGRRPSALVVLTFVADDAKLATMDVALGPCVVSAPAVARRAVVRQDVPD